MAEEKKKPSGWDFNAIESLLILLLVVGIAASLISAFMALFSSGELSFFGIKISSVVQFFRAHLLFFKILGFSIAGGAAVGAITYNKKADSIWRQMKAKLYPENMSVSPISSGKKTKSSMTTRWERIIKLSESQNSSDWRLAIIEADIILDELLEKLKLPGETMGEKLKAIEKSDFLTIDNAWEAHKFRNNIAHEGNDFLVNQQEIRRIIFLYETVFKEFFLI